MSQATGPAAEPSRRTDWTETRQRILVSSRDLFAERGYRGATVRGLAEAAGVSLMTLHRHFPTKAELFQGAVLVPLGEFVERYLASRVERGAATKDSGREMVLFYDGLMAALFSEDKLLIAAASSFTEDEALMSDEMRSYVDAFFGRLSEVVAEKVGEYGLDIDPYLAPRVMVGAALGVVVYRAWLFPTEPRPSRDELVSELAKITIWGVAGKSDGATIGRPDAGAARLDE